MKPVVQAGEDAGAGAVTYRSGVTGTPRATGAISRPRLCAQGAGGRNALVELTVARIREALRERGSLFWDFLFPVLLAAALGIAFRGSEREKIQVAVESSQAGISANVMPPAALAEALSRSNDIAAVSLPPDEAARALRSGKVALVVRALDGNVDASVPGNAERDAAPAAAFSYRFDPMRPESRAAKLVVDDALQRALGRRDVARAGEETVSEPGARYIDFLIPGLIGLTMMGSGMWAIGFAVVTSRLRNLLKRLSTTPMRRPHYLLSFMLSRLIFLAFQVGSMLLFARLMFGYKVHGSFIELTLLLLIGAFTFAGVGLLVAARPRSIGAVSGLINLVMLPMWVLSGTYFSSSRFPDVIQPFIKALPLTALNDSLRAVMNDGASLTSTLTPVSVLLLWGTVSFVVALKIFRWQ
ncbi:MAG TPA: ABC transporter permease [Pyrinomonadaceae bacterium]